MDEYWHSFSIEQLQIARESLKEIHELFSQDGKWTQGAYHRDEEGSACPAYKAACHCTIGAINEITPLGHSSNTYQAILSGNPTVFNRDKYIGIAEWNDAEGRTIGEVLAAIFNGIMFVDAVIQKRAAEFDGSTIA